MGRGRRGECSWSAVQWRANQGCHEHSTPTEGTSPTGLTGLQHLNVAA